MTLFNERDIVGTFYGFKSGGITPTADLLFMHSPDYPSKPIIGMPVLVRLDHDNEALLVRITTVTPGGSLATDLGTDYVMRNIRTSEYTIPENIRQTKLIYRVQGRPLGVLRMDDNGVHFMPTHRRVAPLGSPVTFARNGVFQAVMNADDQSVGVPIGHAALGEFIWGDVNEALSPARSGWIEEQRPITQPRFDIHQLVARRTFVLAKAGYGKSNLVKLLFAELYRDGVPTATRRDGSEVPVGTLVGDLDGEYFWPSADNPGFVDIEHLREHLVIFTDRQPPSDAHGSFVAGGLKLDVREVLPGRIIPLVLPKGRLDQQNVSILMDLDEERWRELVDLTHDAGAFDDVLTDYQRILRQRQGSGDLICEGAYRNVKQVLNALHDERSSLLTDAVSALREGKLVVLDLSLFRARAQALLGIVLSRVFEHNMRVSTDANGQTIPVIAVIEEAQNVLDGKETEVTRPFIEFTKEGRKFYCGIMGITQQPGSIDTEIISQSDNFFAFHLLSEGDLHTLRKANPHFSDDILSSLLNEPLVGSGYFFSLHSNKQYPIPFRPFDFGQRYPGRLESGPALPSHASDLRQAAERRARDADPEAERAVQEAANRLRTDSGFLAACGAGTQKPARVQFVLRDAAPAHITERDDSTAQGNDAFRQPSMKWADKLVDRTICAIFGAQGVGWVYEGGHPFRGKNTIKSLGEPLPATETLRDSAEPGDDPLWAPDDPPF